MNKRRSPPSHINAQFVSPCFPFAPPSKNDLFSSNEESTQEQKKRQPHALPPSSILDQRETYSAIQKAFLKPKRDKEDKQRNSRASKEQEDIISIGLNKNLYIKSDRVLNYYKSGAHLRTKKTDERYHDYFDSKPSALRGLKPTAKFYFYEKLSDSGDSGASQNSAYSVQSEGANMKPINVRKYENIHTKRQPSDSIKNDEHLFTSKNLKLASSDEPPHFISKRRSPNPLRTNHMSPPVQPTSQEIRTTINEFRSYSPQKIDTKREYITNQIEQNFKRSINQTPRNTAGRNQQRQSIFNATDIAKFPPAQKRCSLTPQRKFNNIPKIIQPHQNPASNNKSPIISKTAAKKHTTPDIKAKKHHHHRSDGCMEVLGEKQSSPKQVQDKEQEVDQIYLMKAQPSTPKQRRNQHATVFQADNQRVDKINETYQGNYRLRSSQLTSISSALMDSSYSRQIASYKVLKVIPVTQYHRARSIEFLIMDQIAENKTASIYKCLQPKSGLVYCIKKCKVDPESLNQLILEHKISLVLNHPNLIKGFCTFYDRNSLYLLMEYMEGGTLLTRKIEKLPEETTYSPFKAINTHETPPSMTKKSSQRSLQRNRIVSTLRSCIMQQSKDKSKVVRQIIQKILQAVAYLHRRQIWHRDLKPDNVFISNGTYKVGDFGSCCFNNSQEHVGTLDYAAPEIMLKLPYNNSVDLWSIGCIAYELAVGETPFYDPSRTETIRRIVNIQYDASAVKDPHLRDLIGRMLLRRGDMRITAEQALGHSYFQEQHIQSRTRI